MKIKCENVVICGNYECSLNCEGACIRSVIALNGNGKCAMCKPKEYVKTPAPAQLTKPNKPYDCETSK